MCSMCHYCGAELTQSKEKTCKVCAEKQERESVKQGKAILYTVQMITPTTSLSGSDTSVSSCSKCPSCFLVIHFGLS